MEVPAEVLEQFREYGRTGGRTRADRLTAGERSSIARLGSLARWTRERFGVRHFTDLSLPGADVVDRGLSDLALGVESVPAFLVSLAAPRLKREGVPLPSSVLPDPEWRCYRRLEEEHGDLAHARYRALIREVTSFADACQLVSRVDRRHAT